MPYLLSQQEQFAAFLYVLQDNNFNIFASLPVVLSIIPE